MRLSAALAALLVLGFVSPADAQITSAPPYTTAPPVLFSPPVVVSQPVVTSYYAPARVQTVLRPGLRRAYYAPVTAYYAPPAVTTYYAPPATTTYYAPPAVTTYYAPPATTTYYAPPATVVTPVVVPMRAPVIRRGFFGRLYLSY